MTDAVAPWEAAKLRLLNGAHSGIAYLGGLAGIEFVHQFVALPAGKAFVEKFRKQVGYPPGYVENYCYATVRFIGELVAKGAHDRESIHEAIAKANSKELTTEVPITFDHNGARAAYMYLLQIKSMTKDDFTGEQVNYVTWSPEVLPVYDLVK